MIQFCNESRLERHHPFFPVGQKISSHFPSQFLPKVIILIRKCCQQTTPRYCSIDQLPHGLYGAIGTLHRTEQNRTYRSRNISRDRFLKVKSDRIYSYIVLSVRLLNGCFPRTEGACQLGRQFWSMGVGGAQ